MCTSVENTTHICNINVSFSDQPEIFTIFKLQIFFFFFFLTPENNNEMNLLQVKYNYVNTCKHQRAETKSLAIMPKQRSVFMFLVAM